MDNLFIMLQRDAQVKRRIALLRCLNDVTDVMTLNFLAERLSCTLPTLREDIDVLNLTLKGLLEISTSKQGVVSFLQSSNLSVDSIINGLIKETLPYQIIDGILHERFSTPQEATEELATSRTNFLRTIWHMNEVLENFKIAISTKRNLEFVGLEENIRVFLFSFYLEFGEREIVSNESGETLKGFLNLANEIDHYLHYCHFRLSICVPIVNIRWAQRHFLTLPKHIEAAVVNQDGLAKFKTALKRHYIEDFGIELPEDELVWAFITSVHSMSYSNTPSISQNLNPKKYVYRREAQEETLTAVHQFITDNFSARLLDQDSLEIVEAFIINTLALKQVTPVYGHGSPLLRGLIATLYADSYQKWQRIVDDLADDSILAPLKSESVVTNLAIFDASFRRKSHDQGELYVLFAFQGEPGLDHYLVQWSKILLGENIKADYFLEEMIDEQKVLEIKPDAVICNYDIKFEKTKCPFIRLSNFPTLQEFKAIRDVFDELLSDTKSNLK